MAPLQYSLENDEPGMWGFIYKKLLQTPEGQRINILTANFMVVSIMIHMTKLLKMDIQEKIVIGMLSSDINSSNFSEALDNIKNYNSSFKFWGVLAREYFNCPPSYGKYQNYGLNKYTILLIQINFVIYLIIFYTKLLI